MFSAFLMLYSKPSLTVLVAHGVLMVAPPKLRPLAGLTSRVYDPSLLDPLGNGFIDSLRYGWIG